MCAYKANKWFLNPSCLNFGKDFNLLSLKCGKLESLRWICFCFCFVSFVSFSFSLENSGLQNEMEKGKSHKCDLKE